VLGKTSADPDPPAHRSARSICRDCTTLSIKEAIPSPLSLPFSCVSFSHYRQCPRSFHAQLLCDKRGPGGALSRLISPACHPIPKKPHRPSRPPHHDATIFGLASRRSRDRVELLSFPSSSTDGGPVNIRISTIPSLSLVVEPQFIC
jgi:hypothetical protein